ncbi:hypothetical protein BKA57DRAFT_488706 [Linnemannia elongata]|nr:hypothetical protein BKA57DRAFT_488706 [Linnemannia elongata]
MLDCGQFLSDNVDKRQGKVEVKWIRGHNNDSGNELAERTAKEAAHGDTTPWVVNLTQQEDIRTFSVLSWSLSGDGPEAATQTTNNHSTPSALDFTASSQEGDTPFGRCRVALNPGLYLYPDFVCRVCTEEEEDNEHLWTCPEKRETTTAIWRVAMDKVDDWGIKAVNSYNAAKKREHERAVASGRQEPPPVPVSWRCPSDEEHVRVGFSIGGAQSVYQGQPVPDRDLDPKWRVSDLLRGITPKSMLSE